MITATERSARAMSRVERVAYLKSSGWQRLSAIGSQTWIDPQTGATFTLASAVRVAIEDENPLTDAPMLRAVFELHSAFNRAGWGGGEQPQVCDGCHATVDRIVERGHFGSCERRGRHQHPRHLEIKDCIEWRLYAEDLKEARR